MPGRSNSPYDPFALPVPQRNWTPIKVLALALALVALIALVFVAWSLLGPILFHTASSPLPMLNPAPAQPTHHW
jgi:hypothetical protein